MTTGEGGASSLIAERTIADPGDLVVPGSETTAPDVLILPPEVAVNEPGPTNRSEA